MSSAIKAKNKLVSVKFNDDYPQDKIDQYFLDNPALLKSFGKRAKNQDENPREFPQSMKKFDQIFLSHPEVGVTLTHALTSYKKRATRPLKKEVEKVAEVVEPVIEVKSQSVKRGRKPTQEKTAEVIETKPKLTKQKAVKLDKVQ